MRRPPLSRASRALQDLTASRAKLRGARKGGPSQDPYARHLEPSNAPGIRHVTFVVDDLDAVLSDIRDRVELVGEVLNHEDVDKLCFVRGPAGIIVELAERLG